MNILQAVNRCLSTVHVRVVGECVFALEGLLADLLRLTQLFLRRYF